MVALISCPQLLDMTWGLGFTGSGMISGTGFFDKLMIEERETWTAELWRSSGNARGKDFGGPVSSCSVKSRIPTGSEVEQLLGLSKFLKTDSDHRLSAMTGMPDDLLSI